MSIENLKTFDPFADADEDTGGDQQTNKGEYIHIRIQQRNGRKTLTTIQGLPKKYAFKKILRLVKKRFVCNGTIIEDDEHGSVIQLQGDHRNEMLKFLTDPETSDDKTTGIGLDEKTIKVHGF